LKGIEAENVTAGYDDLAAVRNITFSVDRGEVVSLLGPNGAGKTTLMLSLAGELPLMSGVVRFLGNPATGPLHQRAREGLAFVPEGRSVVSGLTVADNLRLGRGGIDAAVAIFPELKGLLIRPAGLLSGGEQQMLVLGRALGSEPKALLVDELSLGLAPRVVVRLMAAIRNAASETGVAALLVEQQIERAFQVSDRWFILRRGEITANGSRSDGLSAVVEAYSSELPDEAN